MQDTTIIGMSLRIFIPFIMLIWLFLAFFILRLRARERIYCSAFWQKNELLNVIKVSRVKLTVFGALGSFFPY